MFARRRTLVCQGPGANDRGLLWLTVTCGNLLFEPQIALWRILRQFKTYSWQIAHLIAFGLFGRQWITGFGWSHGRHDNLMEASQPWPWFPVRLATTTWANWCFASPGISMNTFRRQLRQLKCISFFQPMNRRRNPILFSKDHLSLNWGQKRVFDIFPRYDLIGSYTIW